MSPENFLLQLRAQRPEVRDWAFVAHQDKIFYSNYSGVSQAPTSALIQLVQGLFKKYEDHTFFILRNRIWTSYELTGMEKEFIKVTAKRASMVSSGNGEARDEANLVSSVAEKQLVYINESISIENYVFKSKDEHIKSQVRAVDLLDEMVSSISRTQEMKHDMNRDIAALMVSREGILLSACTAQNKINKTLHAEVSLVQSYYQKTGRLIPAGAKIYTSLKPCRMCAAMIYHCSEKPETIRVLFQKNDPGSMARNTVLDQKFLNQLLDN